MVWPFFFTNISLHFTGELAIGVGLVCRQESKESLSSDHSGSREDLDEQWVSQVILDNIQNYI